MVRRAKILLPTSENIALVGKALSQGEVVGMPTETVYGLAGNARSSEALAKIFSTKERPTFDPLIIHVDLTAKNLEALVKMNLVEASSLTEKQKFQIDHLINNFWPGPLTLVLPKHGDVPELATSGLPSVALRMPVHPVAQALISAAQSPLAAPSANRFGRISPTTATAVEEELGERIQYILDGGSCEVGVESTIIGLNEKGEWIILRAGGTPQEAIEKVLGENVQVLIGSSRPKAPLAPGMLDSHYAPRTPLMLLSERENFGNLINQLRKEGRKIETIGILAKEGEAGELAKAYGEFSLNLKIKILILGPSGKIEEMARNLFGFMRELDSAAVDVIVAEYWYPELGLGYAIRDRLKRASHS